MNYQKLMDEVIELEKNRKNKPTLLLHACCAPCSSYVLEYLSSFFKITILYYNPNISPYEEFKKRYLELEKLLKEMPNVSDVELVEAHYDENEFYSFAKPLSYEKEGGKRCFKCYELRLREACNYAKENNFDYFTTTLSISPYKNSDKLNEIGEQLQNEYDIKYLYADFKKKNGYKRSIELSKKYNLYRQNYCGCIYSKIERDNKISNKSI